jgi:nucleoside-diphosphate-sugar epimerase
MARVQAIVADLMLGSRVTETLRAAGHEVELSASVEGAGDADVVVADLDAAEPRALAALGPPVLGFYQHTDVATKEAADAAGIALAVPRSRLVREMPELVDRLLAD